jgi:uroporphyrin-3 C-methyltransferase
MSETTPPSAPDSTRVAVLPLGAASSPPRLWRVLVWLSLAVAVLGAAVAWMAWQRLDTMAQELARRTQDNQTQTAEARAMAKQASDLSRELASKVTLTEAKLSELLAQRSQLDALMAALSRSRDENLVADLDAALRLAAQQTQATGSAEPLIAALRAADERLQRADAPRLAGVRRAVLRDLERARATSVIDMPGLSVKLDEASRAIDDLPLVVSPPNPSLVSAAPDPKPASAPTPSAPAGWWASLKARWTEATQRATQTAADEARSLLRISRIDRPEAMLLAPEQAFYVRENVKLKLLNARIALLTRQFEPMRADLASAQQAVERYFDPRSRRVQLLLQQLRQVPQQLSSLSLPRPDESLAALAAVAPR